jgi:hypothetical protein
VTPDELRDAIEATYRSVVVREGGRYPSPVPDGVTPMAWHEVLNLAADDLPGHLASKAEGLAMAGVYYGCDTFARLRVQDRPEAQRRSSGGAMNVRKRQFIVHALGWRDGRSN